MGWFDMIESKARRWWGVISIVINVGNVAVVVDAELRGLQVTEGVGEVSGKSVKRREYLITLNVVS